MRLINMVMVMAKASHIHVRPLEIEDFPFVQDLASKKPNFTVPPSYVLWLMLRIKGAICLVAEHSSDGPVAYLLAVPIEGPNESLFVWQLAVTENGKSKGKVSLILLKKLREMARADHVQIIAFSTRPNSAVHRLITQHTKKLAAMPPHYASALPSSVARNESEYWVHLD
jgi:hypothetical protein